MDPWHWGKHDLGERVRHLEEGKAEAQVQTGDVSCAVRAKLYGTRIRLLSVFFTESCPTEYHYQTSHLWECLYKRWGRFLNFRPFVVLFEAI